MNLIVSQPYRYQLIFSEKYKYFILFISVFINIQLLLFTDMMSLWANAIVWLIWDYTFHCTLMLLEMCHPSIVSGGWNSGTRLRSVCVSYAKCPRRDVRQVQGAEEAAAAFAGRQLTNSIALLIIYVRWCPIPQPGPSVAIAVFRGFDPCRTGARRHSRRARVCVKNTPLLLGSWCT